MQKVSIVVPIYKELLTLQETASLQQLISVLGDYPIRFITHQELNLKDYFQITGHANISVDYFNKEFFKGTYAYNKLLISRDFYQRYQTSKYILIYQLDAWVFKDELVDWCNKGYDYIGAPLYEGFGDASDTSPFLGIGNGGLSLRKVNSYIKVLNSFSFVRSFSELTDLERNSRGEKGSILKLLFDYTFRNNTFHLLNRYSHNEDTFWGKLVPRKFKWFKVPDELTASRFSMEVKAPFLYRANNNRLPFGCHAWEKYHQEFWAEFIHIN